MSMVPLAAFGVLVLWGVAPLWAQDPPLPSRDAFFAAIRARLTQSYQRENQMAYKERGTELQLNPLGRMGAGPEMLAEVYPHPVRSLTYRRVIERNGRRLPASEIVEQDRRHLEKIANAGPAPEDDQRAARQRREMQAEVLDVFNYRIVERVRLDGQPAIVVGFEPKPDARPQTREGRVAASFVGRAWVHEHEFELMRLEADAVKDVAFGWGMIARLHRGSHFESTRRKIDGNWQTTATEFTGSVRALMVRRATIKMHREYFDYRPYDHTQLESLLRPRTADK